MADYKKYMFDNFVISDEEPRKYIPETVVEPVEAEEAAPAEDEIVEAKTAEAEPVAAAEPEVKEVSFSQEELDKAVRAAEEQSYEKGYNAAVSEREKAETLLLDSINNRLMTILADVSTNNAEQEQNALRFAVALVRKLLPQLEGEVAVREVEAFVGDNFKNFAKEGSLSFRFNPEIIGDIAPKLSRLAEKNDFEGKIAIHKDDSLGLSDCKIEWLNGGVEKSAAHTISQVEDLLNN